MYRNARLITAIGWLFLTGHASGQAEAKKYALLVAVTQYNHAAMNEPVRLQFPEEDAQAVAQVFQASGYTVDILLGAAATKDAISQKLESLGTKGNQAGVVVVGFWGHGVEIQGTNEAMFCPFDTTLRGVRYSDGSIARDKQTQQPLNEPEPTTLISMADVLAAIGSSGAGNRVLLADCCRNSPHIPRGRAFGSSVKLSDLPANTAALFACSAGEKAFEFKPWGHGAFTKSLLDLFPQMAANQEDVPAIAGRLKRSVAEAVTTASRGSENQTVNPIINGVPELLLVRPSAPSSTEPAPAIPSNMHKPALSSAKTYVTSPTIGMEFVLVPHGTFAMGSPIDEADRKNDEIEHEVTLSNDFYMGVTEVTQGQWQDLMGTAPWTGQAYLKQEGPNIALTNVNWSDALDFCMKLSQIEGKSYRLPTEAEWEYACRAGSHSAYSFGDETGNINDFAWAMRGGDEYCPHAVGQKKPNLFGLFDMHGNAIEWCSDWYGNYPTDGTVDPPGSSTGDMRVLRGGSFEVNLGYEYFRSAYRSKALPDERESDRGFRVVLER